MLDGSDHGTGSRRCRARRSGRAGRQAGVGRCLTRIIVADARGGVSWMTTPPPTRPFRPCAAPGRTRRGPTGRFEVRRAAAIAAAGGWQRMFRPVTLIRGARHEHWSTRQGTSTHHDIIPDAPPCARPRPRRLWPLA